MKCRTELCWLVFLSLLLAPSLSWAQAQDLDETTRSLHNRAIKKLNAGDPDAAIELLNAAITSIVAAKGKDARAPNILYLSLGRAFQKKNWCADAQENYMTTISAGTPKVESPPAGVVLAQASKFIEELKSQKTCMARVRVICEPTSAALKIGDGEEGPCLSGEPRYVAAGQTTLTISVGDKSRQVLQTLAPSEDRTIRLELDLTEPKPPVAEKTEPKKDPVVIKETTIIKEKAKEGKVVAPKVINNIEIQNGEAFNGPVFFANLVLSAVVLTGVIAYDTCGFNYAANKAAYNADPAGHQGSFCTHTYDGQFTGHDFIPIAGYLGVIGLMLWQPIQF